MVSAGPLSLKVLYSAPPKVPPQWKHDEPLPTVETSLGTSDVTESGNLFLRPLETTAVHGTSFKELANAFFPHMFLE